MKKIRTELTTFESRIDEFVKRYEMKHKKKPYLYEVCNELNSIDYIVLRGLNKLYKQYPGSLIVTTKDKLLVELYKQLSKENGENLTLSEFAQKIGKDRDHVANHKKGMEKLGVVFKGNRPPYKLKKDKGETVEEDGPTVYIKVKDGLFKGMTGYIESITDTVNVVLWIGTRQHKARLETCEYMEIRRTV